VPFLGEIPILPAIRAAGDQGLPIVAAAPDSPAAQAFLAVARACAAQLSTLGSPAPNAPRSSSSEETARSNSAAGLGYDGW
jgi:ATP-binding protein involved in chromosome partitioning